MMEAVGAAAGPSPEVQYLATVFRRIRAGDLRMPAFQRDFIWSATQIAALLDSVYRGFPIGSLLFWRVHRPILKVQEGGLLPFPRIPETYPLHFVLDGMQRLSSLYGVFNYGDDGVDGIFDFWFDLNDHKFQHRSDLPHTASAISLADLFKPKELLAAQARFLKRTDGEHLVEQSISLQAAFQERMIPLVTIEREDIGDVVEMFERVNSTGVRLSSVDFMRAVTWSQDFDLNDEIASIQTAFDQRGYTFDEELIVKLLAISLGRLPLPESMLTLRDCADDELHRGVQRVEYALDLVIDFLREQLNILSADYIPYEGQVLILASLFLAADGGLDRGQAAAARRWFLLTGLNETLRGKPDNYIARIISVISSDPDARTTPSISLRTSATDFLERRFIKGKALSSAFATMYGLHEPRSIVTGKPISPADYMSSFALQNFGAIAGKERLTVKGAEAEGRSAKTLSNMVLLSNEDVHTMRDGSILDCLRRLAEHGDEITKSILRSHFVMADAQQALIQGDMWKFRSSRAIAIQNFAEALGSN